MAINTRNESTQENTGVEVLPSRNGAPSIIAKAKHTALALLLSTGLAGSPAMAEEKLEGVQVAANGNVVPVAVTNSPENAHVPSKLRQAIIDEAIAKGADTDFDIPALNDYLDTLAQTGDLTEDELAVLQDMAPKQSKKLPIVIALNQVNGDLENVNGDLENVNGDLEKAKKLLKKSKKAADLAAGS